MVNGLKKNTYYKCLPDSLEDFNHLFIDNAFSIKNELMLKRRILGLTSFFENVDKKLMPSFDKEQDIIIHHIKMSKHQFNQYNIIRAEERKQELKDAWGPEAHGSQEALRPGLHGAPPWAPWGPTPGTPWGPMGPGDSRWGPLGPGPQRPRR